MAALVSDPLGEEKKKKTALKKSGGDCDQTGILARGQLLRRWLLPPVLAAGAALFLVSHYVGYGTFWNLTPTAQLNREDLFTVWMVEEKQLVRKKVIWHP